MPEGFGIKWTSWFSWEFIAVSRGQVTTALDTVEVTRTFGCVLTGEPGSVDRTSGKYGTQLVLYWCCWLMAIKLPCAIHSALEARGLDRHPHQPDAYTLWALVSYGGWEAAAQLLQSWGWVTDAATVEDMVIWCGDIWCPWRSHSKSIRNNSIPILWKCHVGEWVFRFKGYNL